MPRPLPTLIPLFRVLFLRTARGTRPAWTAAATAVVLGWVAALATACGPAVKPAPKDFALVKPAADDPLAANFAKVTAVFGVRIAATAATPDAKVMHAAHVMARYLDQDQDGAPDVQAVVDAMVTQNALLVMGASADELEASGVFTNTAVLGQFAIQDLYADETAPEGGFDASLEEVMHLIYDKGYTKVWPDVFGTQAGSRIADAMDKARGGRFTSIPSPYPDGAWFTYDDATCDYTCMVTEYQYWALTSLLDAQKDRCDEIGHEWKLCTAAQVRETDPDVTALLQNATYGFPTVAPDGTYTVR